MADYVISWPHYMIQSSSNDCTLLLSISTELEIVLQIVESATPDLKMSRRMILPRLPIMLDVSPSSMNDQACLAPYPTLWAGAWAFSIVLKENGYYLVNSTKSTFPKLASLMKISGSSFQNTVWINCWLSFNLQNLWIHTHTHTHSSWPPTNPPKLPMGIGLVTLAKI